MAQIVRGEIRQAMSLHKTLQSPCDSIGISGFEYTRGNRKQIGFIENRAWVLCLYLLLVLEQKRKRAVHQWHSSDTVFGFWCSDYDTVSRGISHISGNPDGFAFGINVFPFQTSTFPAPYSSSNQQLEKAAEIKRIFTQGGKKSLCLLLCKCIYWMFLKFRGFNIEQTLLVLTGL